MVRAIVRFVISALVLLVVAWLVPGFHLVGFWSALLAAVAIAAIGWVVQAVMGRSVSPQARGFTGFITAAVVIWLAQFFVPGMRVGIVGALVAAFVIGIADAVVPTELR